MNGTEARAVGRLLDTFGGDVLVDWRREADRSAGRRLRDQTAVDEMVEAVDGATVLPAWAPLRLARTGRVAIVGPSPTYEDVKHGTLGWSGASRRIHQELRTCGVRTDHVTDLSAIVHWPSNGPRSQRPPTTRELTQARPLLLSALDAADVDHVVLHGSHAMHQWRKDLKLDEVAGGQYLWAGRWWVTPVLHWSAVNYDRATHERRWCEQIAQFVETIYDDAPVVSTRLGTVCVAKGCGAGLYGWDQDGVPWCRTHVGVGQGGHRATRVNAPVVQGGLAL